MNIYDPLFRLAQFPPSTSTSRHTSTSTSSSSPAWQLVASWNLYFVGICLIFQISKHLQSKLQNFTNRAQVEVVAIEATSAVIQSLLIALYVDSSDSKAVEKAKEIVAEK